jgi:VWFA-related protein
VRIHILTSFVLAAAGAAALSAAQSPASTPAQSQTPQSQSQQQDQRPPTFRTEANYVRVDAYPTRNGVPVQDLTADDFEIFEDNKPQAIQQFEHVLVSPAGPQSERAEPNTIGEMKQLMSNPRNRVFVLFLDIQHVTVEGAWHAREPLIRLIDRMLGPDDLVGIMTTRMSAADLVLARKTQVMASGLRDIWPWGERFTLLQDEKEKLYETCFGGTEATRSVFSEMVARKRERQALTTLYELVTYLRDVREERKAIITVTEGWLLFGENHDLTRPRVVNPLTGATEPVPGPDPVGVGPDGRLTLHKNNTVASADYTKEECDRDRLALSLIDDARYVRETLIPAANRGNATFYTIDPRGLPAFDTPIGPEPPLDIVTDRLVLTRRLDTLHMLADNTDGIAVVNNNDLDKGLKRIAADLSSYYLIGYYSTNAKLDGKYHTIKVRVKRQGIDVRARKGYLSPTEEEVMTAKRAAAAPIPVAAAAVGSAMNALSRLRPDTRFSMNAVAIAAGPARTISTIWIAGELPASPANNPWAKGGTVSLDIRAGSASTTARVSLAAGERTFAIPVKLPAPVQSGALDVRATLTGTDPDAERFSDILSLDLAAASSQPMIYRRGAATGNRLLPAASFQFSRTERAHLEFPVAADVKTTGARLLDKAGQPLTIPVTVGERTDDQTGQHWLTADITLAALAAADYALEVGMTSGAGEQKVVTAIRVAK